MNAHGLRFITILAREAVMAANAVNQMNLRLINSFFGTKKSKFGFRKNASLGFASFSFSADSFSFRSSTQVIQLTVQKMQAALNQSVPGQTTASRGGQILQPIQTLTPTVVPPTRQEIETGIAAAGGREALADWLVDGKTKINVNGRKVVVDVESTSTDDATDISKQTAKDATTLKNEAAKSIARFGLNADSLDGDGERLREQLKEAAAKLSQENPNLSLAVEYALEDAFGKISAWEGAVNGTETFDYEKQRETNLAQAESIAKQLNLGEGDSWGIQSLAQDLAVFGMDMTAMAKDPYELAEEIRTKSKDMLADLESRYVGTETEFIQQRNRITGSSARLVNGLEGSAGSMIFASMSLDASFSSSKVSVSVNGTTIDANAVISVGNVIVDPLVLDLNGDGIDLKGADEGVDFDMNGNGEKTGMGFIRGDDAFLFVDEHGDGLVRDGRQLFGNADGHANGFEKLRAYDDNGDGVIDENDAIWDKLMVWQEKNENGVCEEGETMTLAEAGIKSINVGYQNVREDDGKGNLIGQTGSFTRADGTEGMAADVWLQEQATKP